MLESLWIILDNGLCAYEATFMISDSSQDLDGALYTGFISAIFSFSQELLSDSIESLHMKNKVFHYIKDESGTLISVMTSPNVKFDDIHKLLQIIAELFHKYFPQTELAIDSNDSRFLEFEKELSLLIKQKRVALRTPLGRRIEKTLQCALTGQKSIEDVVKLVKELYSTNISKYDKNKIRELLSDLFALAESLGLSPEIVKRLEMLEASMKKLDFFGFSFDKKKITELF
ncbi:MAG: hypothetical protein ACFFC7_15050 [Candidatus Hermodarchaeota archaeon]